MEIKNPGRFNADFGGIAGPSNGNCLDKSNNENRSKYDKNAGPVLKL